jgi:hypothetical protein
MLTTSMNPQDEKRAAKYQVVRHFIRKPLTQGHVREVVDLIDAKP